MFEIGCKVENVIYNEMIFANIIIKNIKNFIHSKLYCIKEVLIIPYLTLYKVI